MKWKRREENKIEENRTYIIEQNITQDMIEENRTYIIEQNSIEQNKLSRMKWKRREQNRMEFN